MQQSLVSCNIRELLVLSHVSARMRAMLEPVINTSVLREALVCEPANPSMDYLAEFALCDEESITRAHFREAPIHKIAYRIVAHASASGAYALADWILEAHIPNVSRDRVIDLRTAFTLMRGDRNALTTLSVTNPARITLLIKYLCAFALSKYAKPLHYEILSKNTTNPEIRHSIINELILQCLTCVHSGRANGEWIEALLARDIFRACEIISVSRELTEHLPDGIEHAFQCAALYSRVIHCDAGPRLLRKLREYHLDDAFIEIVSADSAEFDAFACELHARCLQAQTISDTNDIEDIEFALWKSAGNSDDRVFARVFNILDQAAQIPREYKVMHCAHRNPRAIMLALNRMESCNIHVTFERRVLEVYFADVLITLSMNDALDYARFMFARDDVKAWLSYSVLTRAINMFGDPMRAALGGRSCA